jgi:hypothetical protein
VAFSQQIIAKRPGKESAMPLPPLAEEQLGLADFHTIPPSRCLQHNDARREGAQQPSQTAYTQSTNQR